MKAIRFACNFFAGVARAVRRAAVPCLLVMAGTSLASVGVGYLASGDWATGLRVGLVLGSFFALASWLLVNPLTHAGETEFADGFVRPADFTTRDNEYPNVVDINPATGRAMVGGVDIGGNLTGCSS